jgi:methylglutamate dehydrogenase subunit D
MLERTSALRGVWRRAGRDGASGRNLRIGEARGWRLVQIAGFPLTATALARATRPLLGADLPISVGQAISLGSRLMLKIGPEQFWIITRDDEDIAAVLQSVILPTVGSVTPLTHSRTCIWIEGSSAPGVLASGVPLDLHPEVFRPGFFALTGLHHTPIMIHRSSALQYELYVLRTFATWTWEWLIDAAAPFGYEVVAPE